MSRALFGAGPYGGVASERSLGAVTRDDAAAFHAAHWRPDAAVLVISGDVTAEEGFALAERHFGSWVRPATPAPAQPDASIGAPAPRTIVVDLPQTGQAAVAFGTLGVARASPDYLPGLLATDVLGGGYSSRLNAEIRIRRGLSYGAFAGMSPRMAPAPIVASAQTRNDATVQVANLLQAELNRMGDALAPPAELNARKAALIGEFGRSVETTAGIAGEISALALFGLPLDRLSTYVADVNAITAEQVRAFSDQHFDPARADVVVVGDAQIFWDQLRRQRRNAERIPVGELNLDTESLR
jgi:zinc protease